MPEHASRRGAVDMGMPLMILAFIVIGGFLYWLSGQAAQERASRVVEEAPEEVVDDSRADLNIDPSALGMDAAPFEGTEVRIEGLNVASLLGSQGFWIELPNGNPFLVAITDSTSVEGLEADATVDGVPVGPGEATTVLGVVTAMSPEMLDAWTEAGTITANDRIIAEFATHYIHATVVEVGVAPAAGSGNEEGSDESSEGN